MTKQKNLLLKQLLKEYRQSLKQGYDYKKDITRKHLNVLQLWRSRLISTASNLGNKPKLGFGDFFGWYSQQKEKRIYQDLVQKSNRPDDAQWFKQTNYGWNYILSGDINSNKARVSWFGKIIKKRGE